MQTTKPMCTTSRVPRWTFRIDGNRSLQRRNGPRNAHNDRIIRSTYRDLSCLHWHMLLDYHHNSFGSACIPEDHSIIKITNSVSVTEGSDLPGTPLCPIFWGIMWFVTSSLKIIVVGLFSYKPSVIRAFVRMLPKNHQECTTLTKISRNEL